MDCKDMTIKEIQLQKPKSRSDMIKTLRDLLELAHKEEIRLLEVSWCTDNVQHSRVHVDGVYSSEWMLHD